MDKVLNATREVVSSQQRGEFSNVNILGDDVFKQFCDLCMDLLLNQPQDFVSKLESLASDTGCSLNFTKNAVKALLGFFRSAAKNNLPPKLLESDMQELGLSDEKVQCASELWTSNFLKICTSLLNQTFTVNRLVDLEWKFGVTAASSELEKVGSTFLQLKLIIACGTDQTEDVTVELSLPQFYEFLHEMEKAKASLDALT